MCLFIPRLNIANLIAKAKNKQVNQIKLGKRARSWCAYPDLFAIFAASSCSPLAGSRALFRMWQRLTLLQIRASRESPAPLMTRPSQRQGQVSTMVQTSARFKPVPRFKSGHESNHAMTKSGPLFIKHQLIPQASADTTSYSIMVLSLLLHRSFCISPHTSQLIHCMLCVVGHAS